MIRIFEGIALVAAGGLVSGLVAVAVLHPPDIATGAPHAVFTFLKNHKIVNENIKGVKSEKNKSKNVVLR